MSRTASAPLYSPDLLALAVELSSYPFDTTAEFLGEARSRSCGSTLQMSFENRMQGLGMKVTACAVGQASAAIFARHADGKSTEEIAQALEQITQWLAGERGLPEWPDFAPLSAAQAFPGRHGAILLPWKAALDALSKGGAGR